MGKSSIKSRIWDHRLLQDRANTNANTNQNTNINYNYKYENRCNIIIRTAHLCQALVYDQLGPSSPPQPPQHLAGREDLAGWPGI